ncbi:DNA (cytosine-5-)-methyltransferase [Staphylococcus chromogenes]|uniref:DNA (cytosine-5-)-methyltransferase n=1 Tax=Staphylococcus chromogenes TaxID=46126 RepID=UPI0028889F7F|nr:DNA (cytosine-5-)-methyltransferase [Staphylococcus chromogenes]MDT0670649.1 DNA (cytosine-5-)-methyltransferase [Staphylococcus chromogenes]
MNFIDICSGIGGFRSALENHSHKCLAYSEIDKYAKQSYKAIYDTEGEEDLDDITKITDEHFRNFRGKCDLITGGFPCQSFSIAGKRRGFEDTRGTVFFHIARAIKQIEPSFVLLENVKGLLSHDKGRTFGTIIQALDELGYVTEWGVFNSKYWGVPQNRERVYILVTRKDVFNGPKLFNLIKQQTDVTTRLIDVLETDVDESYYLSDEKIAKLTLNEDLSGKLNHYNYRELDTVHSPNKVSPTLNTMQGGGRQPKISVVGNTFETGYNSHNVHDANGLMSTLAARDYKGPKQIIAPVLTPDRINKRQNGRRFKDNNEPMFTLTAQDRHGIAIKEATKKGYAEANVGDSVNYTYPTSTTRRGRVGKQIAQTLQAGEVNQGTVLSDLRIRKLTPLECWRLQGFTDEQFYKAKNDGVSNSQLYKQAGNAVTVNVVDAIISNLEVMRNGGMVE